jgi:hypothetical protein
MADDLDVEERKRKISSSEAAFLERVRRVIWGRMFFKVAGKTARNTEPIFGLGPADLRAGEVVCISFGCSDLVKLLYYARFLEPQILPLSLLVAAIFIV